MITFVCCSIRPEMAAALNENIGKTVGVPYEFIAFDNREAGHGICKVYNDCAQKAQYDYLCFVHEDVQFNTLDWGADIIEKLSEPDCGAIGFAGSIVKLDLPSGWGCLKEGVRENLLQHTSKGVKKLIVNPDKEKFAQVVTLDGLCIFVRKDVWSECRFDEEVFGRFHCYDLDFALTVAQKYKNYVCYSIEVEHFSEGSHNKQWVDETFKLHDKWRSKLPMGTPKWVEISPKAMIHAEYYLNRMMMKNCASFINPTSIAFHFYTKYWNKSHYAWLILLKILTDNVKKKHRQVTYDKYQLSKLILMLNKK